MFWKFYFNVKRYKRMPKEIFNVRKRITLQAVISDCLEQFVLEFSPENTGDKVFLLVTLWTNCLE